MSSYLYNTKQQQSEMLNSIGLSSVDELFKQIPQPLRFNRPLDLPAPLSEMELEGAISKLANINSSPTAGTCFLGGGVYDHYIPAVVDEIVSRGEFYTAYTPYQAEASQGSLQAFFEYQTLICQLTGMDVSNASLYEGGTAVSEAAFMAMRVTRRHSKIVVAGSVHPEFIQILQTYLTHLNCDVVIVPTPDGSVDVAAVEKQLDDQTACLIIQSPNFFGIVEEVKELSDLAHAAGALSVLAFDPVSMGLLARPGDCGVDIAVAEGQSLGIPMQYGGPFLGILACKQKFVRKMPGRLIGETVDRHGKRCFVLNLQAREQHIRREKATSNICTNQGLLALRATIHLSLLGKEGLKEVSTLSFQKAHYAAKKLCQIDGFSLMYDRPFFKEFVLKCHNPHATIAKTKQAGFDIGPILQHVCKNNMPSDGLLVAVTEKRTKAEIDQLVEVLK